MPGRSKPMLKHFAAYVGWGIVACVFVIIPLLALEWIVQNVPFLDDFVAWLQGLGQPGVALVLGVLAAVFLLAVLGFVLRRFLWDSVCRMPVIGTLLTSGQQLAQALSKVDRESRDLVVWVPFRFYRSLGIVMSRTTDADGTEYANVYVLHGAGQFQGNQIANVELSHLVFPGWTVDEAIVFNSSGGAVTPPKGDA